MEIDLMRANDQRRMISGYLDEDIYGFKRGSKDLSLRAQPTAESLEILPMTKTYKRLQGREYEKSRKSSDQKRKMTEY